MAKFLLLAAVVIQFIFWDYSTQFKPNLGIVPPLPTAAEKAALSLGDDQFYFYMNALKLQMSGDTFGRSTPLKDYNYPLLNKWFYFLDSMDSKSNFVPSLAAYYFSRSQNPKDVVYIVDYLEDHALKDPPKKWWWLSQAIYLANSMLKDKQRALRYAGELRAVQANLPLWARQMEVFMHEELGDKDQAEKIMCQVFGQAKHLQDADEAEQNFMVDFFQKRMDEAVEYKPGMTDAERQERLAQVAQICARKYSDR